MPYPSSTVTRGPRPPLDWRGLSSLLYLCLPAGPGGSIGHGEAAVLPKRVLCLTFHTSRTGSAGRHEARTYLFKSAPVCSTTTSPTSSAAGTPASPTPSKG